MEQIEQEVRYDLYCKKCKYKDLDENKSPCEECSDQPIRQYSCIPLYFEKDGKNERKTTPTVS